MAMSVFFKCDGCGRTEPGIWEHEPEPESEEQRCQATCGEMFELMWLPHPRWLAPLQDTDDEGGRWWSRAYPGGEQHACGRACIDLVAKKTGRTSEVYAQA